MIRLKIDGRTCDTPQSFVLPVGFDAARLADVQAGRSGRRLTLVLPGTPANDRIFGFPEDVYAAERFNAAAHRAEVEADGIRVMAGVACLLASSRGGEGGSSYTVEITGDAALWARYAALTLVRDAGIEFATALTLEDIGRTMTADSSPVRFLPLCRSTGQMHAVSSSSLLPAERIFTVDDYWPFVSVSALVESIFERSGYELVSRFCRSDLFKSLYMSGSYTESDTSRQMSRAASTASWPLPTSSAGSTPRRGCSAARWAISSMYPRPTCATSRAA